ncbi:MAG: right-handed parallel beta-helix repeat-containing protein [Candidatus Aenigmarchaeota archaeon]|nr:right-handed parallel beta-helix repeat-containing protein [Candidatus Aenigmarchaeota archaeon]
MELTYSPGQKNRSFPTIMILALQAIIAGLLFSLPAYATNISSCSIISAPGNYTLVDNITLTTGQNCIEVNIRDVVIDCAGNAIAGSGSSGTSGVYASKDGFILRNCTITNFHNGLRMEGSNNGLVENSRIIGNYRGITLSYSENNAISNTLLIQNNIGVQISFSERNRFYNNLLNNTNNTVFIGTNENTWYSSKEKGKRIYSPGTYIGGNYWSNPGGGPSDSCNDANRDGFCDEPYEMDPQNRDSFPLSNRYLSDTVPPTIIINSPKTNQIVDNTTITISITANDAVYAYTNLSIMQGNETVKSAVSTKNGTFEEDLKVNKGGYYNITATAYDMDGNSASSTVYNILTPLEVTSCSDLNVAGEKYTVENTITHTSGSICLNIQADNIILDCKNRAITGKEAAYKTYGISLNGRKNVTIKNCIVSEWDYGIFSQFSTGNHINNNLVLKNRNTGIYLYSSGGNEIQGNVIGNNTMGIRLYSSSDNRIYNNVFSNEKEAGFEGETLKNYWNVEKKEGLRVTSKGSKIGGNFWSGKGNDYSIACTDKDTDGFCDEPYDVGYGSQNSGTGFFLKDIITGLFLTLSVFGPPPESNNIDYLPLSDEFAPDVTPPATNITITLPNGKAYNSSQWISENYVNVTAYCSDGYGSGCKRILYCIDRYGNCTPETTYKEPFKIEPDKNLTEQIYLRYYSVDKEDNNETIKIAMIRSLSSSQKVVISSPLEGDQFNSTNITLSGTVLRENEHNTTQINIYNSSGNVTRTVTITANGTFERNLTLPGEGTYLAEVIFRSIYGFNTTESEFSIIVDLTPPTISFKLNKEKVFEGETIIGTCNAQDNFKGSFQGTITGINTSSEGAKSATCIAIDDAGNIARETLDYLVEEKVCTKGEKKCASNVLYLCEDNAWTEKETCEYGCDAKNKVCISAPKNNSKNGTIDPRDDDPNQDDGDKELNPTVVATSAFLLLFIVGVMAFLYFKIFQKPTYDFDKKLAFLEARVREAESKGKDTTNVRSELEMAEQEVSMGLFEMAGPRIKALEKDLKRLK